MKNFRIYVSLLLITFALTLVFSACAHGSGSGTSPSDAVQKITDTDNNTTPIAEELPDKNGTSSEENETQHSDTEENTQVLEAQEIDTKTEASELIENLQVVFFDVGQADCALIKAGEHAMLIDAGNTDQDSLILSYLLEYEINKLDFLVATHPHADHIGSMAAVIMGMDSIEELLMPDAIHTTETFENLLDAVEEKGLSVTVPNPGEVFKMGNAAVQILAPNNDQYDDLNNFSLVLRIEYGQTVFLFAGDAEDVSENEQLQRNYDLDADVLKVGHHGSDSSTTQGYLDAVSPSYAIISCGKDNSYGHPHKEVITRLAEKNVEIYRTDTNGTIIFSTDGKKITVITEREENTDTTIKDVLPAEASETVTAVAPDADISDTTSYIGNKNSKIFHYPSCGTLPAEKNRVYFSTRDEAISSNYRPCKNCTP